MSDDKPTVHDPHSRWLDQAGIGKKLVMGLSVVCVLLFFADAAYHKHSHFEAEGWFGFYAFFSFVACTGLLIVARFVRALLIRDEGYYDSDE